MTTTTTSPAPRPVVRRVVELGLVPLVIAAGFVVPVLLWGDRLPDPIASHWGPSGTPDDAMAASSATGMFLAMWALFWAGVVAAILARKLGGQEARVVIAGLYWLGGVLVAMWVLGLRSNLDAPTWDRAADLEMGWLFASMALALPLAALGWWLADGHPGVDAPEGVTVAPVTAPSGSTAVWSGTATNRALLAGVVLFGTALALAAVVAEGLRPVLGWNVVVLLVVASFAGSLRASAGPKGLRISMGWLGWPARTIAPSDIAAVRVEPDASPWAYGGWGLRLAKGTQAHVVRRGPAIRVKRTDGRSDVLVTVDDAERGAAVLAGHLDLDGRG